jgi:hypothetical protein
MLAAASGAELVLPPAFTRRTFGEKEAGHHTWAPLPLEQLLDVEQIRRSWQKRGVVLHRVSAAVLRCSTKDMRLVVRESMSQA